MTDNVTKLPERDAYDFMIGPFEEHRVCIEGRIIPHLTAYRDGPNHIGLVLEHRLSVSVPKEFGRQVAWLLANAIAIGAGYSHLGATSKNRPFAPLAGDAQELLK